MYQNGKNITNDHNFYQIGIKKANDHKEYQMVIKDKSIPFQGLPKHTKNGSLGRKIYRLATLL
jgi:hypothetical protein